MARKRSLDAGQNIAEDILDGAAALFHRHGYDATSIRDLAETVGISSSTLYHHYANKQDILYAVIVRFMRVFNAAIIPILRDEELPVAQRLEDAVRLHLSISDERRPELLPVYQFRNALTADQLREVIGLQWEHHDALKDLIRHGCAVGELATDDIDLTTMAIEDMLNGVRAWFSHAGPLSLTDLLGRYTAMVGKLLSVPS
ncbi:MAG TPA: TetR/AcrR family transcriptional regulator [Pseudonocardia sp.]|jgi:AcrR family transcriptional regulator|nr:TetR/AcrR family transcriptional regulator [Pseudonocardia sp.]